MFLRTLREDPADADVNSAKLLQRAGYIRKAAPGIWTWLPLGLRVLNKIEAIVREEIDGIGAQEVHFPALLPREPYEATHRWEEYGDNIFRLKDRHEADYLLAPTHEEMFTLLVKDMYSSYKDLPVTLYQIQTKYRDEFRPRAGLIRGREFIMKDAYSFTIDEEGMRKAYYDERGAYERIFRRLDLKYVPVFAMSGPMGGSASEEFLAPMPIGEDTFALAPSGKAWNVEALTTPEVPAVDCSATPAMASHETPDSKTIEALVATANKLYPREDGREWTAADTLKTVSNYVDVVAMRHPKEGAALVASRAASVPVINAGDGGHMHPTQTLADLATLQSRFGRVTDLTVGLCGDLTFGRTVHSLIETLCRFGNVRFVLISPDELKTPQYVLDRINATETCSYTECRDLVSVIGDLDVL